MTTPTPIPLTRTGYCASSPSDAPDDADVIITSYLRSRAHWTPEDHRLWENTPATLLISGETTTFDHDVLLVTPWEYIAAVQWLVTRKRAQRPAGLLVRSLAEWSTMIRCLHDMGLAAHEAWWWVQDLAADPHDLHTHGYPAPYPDAPPALIVGYRQMLNFRGGLIEHLLVAPTLPTEGDTQ